MAQHVENDIVYFLSIPQKNKDNLGAIRHWNQLSIAFEKELIWIKGIREAEINSPEILCLPGNRIYFTSDQQLFLKGNLLPSRRVPSLLWSPIKRGLPLEWPKQNHNFFGIPDRLKVELIPNETTQDLTGMIIDLQVLANYMETAPAIRLAPLKWLLLGEKKALVLGKPLLPLPGKAFWVNRRSLIPAGLQFKYPVLTEVIAKSVNPEGDCLILWGEDCRYVLIPEKTLKQLSISSFRKTVIGKD